MLEISVKCGQQSMKLWWTACNTLNSSSFLFILKAPQVPHTSHEHSAGLIQPANEWLWSYFQGVFCGNKKWPWTYRSWCRLSPYSMV